MIRNVLENLSSTGFTRSQRLATYATLQTTRRASGAISRVPSRPRRRDEDEVDDTRPPLPQYIRRKSLSSTSQALPMKPTLPSRQKLQAASFPRKPTKYRSRHYDPSQHEDVPETHLLEPHVLSARLKKLCDAGNTDAAVTMLKNSPLDAQNTPVWNTLIWECMKAKRYKLAYQLFTDMKRRGFSPTTRTFQTMFTGFSKIEIWELHTKQFANARSLYEAFQRYIDAVKRTDPKSSELSSAPLASYIKILGDAGQYQDIFDVYYAMDTDGPMAPNQFIFTVMFQVLSKVKAGPLDGVSTSSLKTAADAKLLWTQMLKASKKSPGFPVDSYLVASAITALARGGAAEQELAFQIVREYLGLTVPEDGGASPGHLALQPQTLAAALKLCNESQKHSLCIEFYNQVKRRPSSTGDVALLDRPHMEEVLKAWLSMPVEGSGYRALDTLEWMLRQEITGYNGPKIRPSLSTFTLVMMACWRSVDWNSATRTFELLTGYHAHDFMDGVSSEAPRFTQRSKGRNLEPSAEFMSAMMRTALATKNRANMRQCLRIVDHLGMKDLLSKTTVTGTYSRKAVKSQFFYASKLAGAVVDIVQYVLLADSGRRRPSEAEVRRWQALASTAKKATEDANSSQSSFLPVKDKPLASSRGRERRL